MNPAKIQLSEDELQLALNESVILTKNLIIEKVCRQWEFLSHAYQQVDMAHLPEAATNFAPKVSRGENYNGLPYVILDYPRCFTKQDIFAIRTMFWWGHDLSITLHLKGVYQQAFGAAVAARLNHLLPHEWWLQHSGDEWQHHYSKESHTSLQNGQWLTSSDDFKKIEFIKVVGYLPLASWDAAIGTLLERFSQLVHMLKY